VSVGQPNGAGSLYGDGGRRDSDGGTCWRPLRVGRQPLCPRGLSNVLAATESKIGPGVKRRCRARERTRRLGTIEMAR
jgi:hypothetical protein